MQIDLVIVLEKLEELRDKIHGCGNGRIMVDKFIKETRAEYGLDKHSNSVFVDKLPER